VILILTGAILMCMFVPKIKSLKTFEKNRSSRVESSVKVSGASAHNSAQIGLSSSLRSAPTGDAIAADILRHFQKLSWEDKSNVMKKLGAVHSVYPSHTVLSSTQSDVLSNQMNQRAGETKGSSSLTCATNIVSSHDRDLEWTEGVIHRADDEEAALSDGGHSSKDARL
jgi:hypothetical protein